MAKSMPRNQAPAWFKIDRTNKIVVITNKQNIGIMDSLVKVAASYLSSDVSRIQEIIAKQGISLGTVTASVNPSSRAKALHASG